MSGTHGTVSERLVRRLVRQPNGCLEWTGYTGKGGYGRIHVGDTMALVHRVAWKLANGPIPDGMDVLHHCDNPPCCDTDTCLFLGTDADNAADRDAKGRCRAGAYNAAKTHCKAGHEYTEANTYTYKTGRYCRACHALTERARRQEARVNAG